MKILNLLFVPIKWLLKIVLKCAVVFVLLAILMLACSNLWLPWIASNRIRSMTGFDTSIKSSHGSLFRGHIDFQDVTIKNPPGQFSELAFVSFSDLGVDIDLKTIFKDTLVFENVILDIDNITIVKNADGTTNYSVFIENFGRKKHKKKREVAQHTTRGKSSEKSFSRGFSIQKFVLAIRSIKIIDEKTNNEKEYSIKYRREFFDVSDLSSLVTPLIADLSIYGLGNFIQSTIKSIGNIPGISQIKKGLTNVKDTSVDTVKNIGSKVKDIFSK